MIGFGGLSRTQSFWLVVPTVALSGEVRGATWDEVDTSRGVWTIPAERMKASQEHRVPLSAKTVDLLREAKEFADESGLVFPSTRGRPLSDSTLSKLLRELGGSGGSTRFQELFQGLVRRYGATEGDCGGGVGAYGSRRRGSIFSAAIYSNVGEA